MNFKKYHESRNLWDNRGFSASVIGLNHTHNISNNYGTTLSTTTGNEVTITQSAYPTGNINYQNGFFMIDVDFSEYAVGDVVTISFDYIVNEIHALSTQFQTAVYAGKNNNTITPTLSSGDWKISGRLTVVVTIIEDMNPYVEVRLCGNSITVKNIMLNTGSTPLPYEPYSSEVWHDIPYYQHKTATDTLTLPAVIYPNDTSITVGIKGQSSQSGTPSSQNPVDGNGTGERTENLVDVSTFQDGMHLDITTGLPASFGGRRIATMQPIDVSQYNNVTVTFDEISHSAQFMYSIFNGDTLIERVANKSSGYTIDTSNATKMYLSLYTCVVSDVIYIMLNTGSTALPYEPYGYKIPILLNSTTVNKYLGTEQTERQIIKYEFTGGENWIQESGNTYVLEGVEQTATGYANALCTHYILATSYKALTDTDGTFAVSVRPALFIHDENYTSVTQLKNYLATQYNNGTPVTIYYTLKTPTTSITNEPLMKIGIYADSLTTSIPCTAGENTLDVQTTVQPSEVTAGFSGWHPAIVHERTNGAWT